MEYVECSESSVKAVKTLILGAWFLLLNVARLDHCVIEHAKRCLCCLRLSCIRMSKRVSAFPETLPY